MRYMHHRHRNHHWLHSQTEQEQARRRPLAISSFRVCKGKNPTPVFLCVWLFNVCQHQAREISGQTTNGFVILLYFMHEIFQAHPKHIEHHISVGFVFLFFGTFDNNMKFVEFAHFQANGKTCNQPARLIYLSNAHLANAWKCSYVKYNVCFCDYVAHWMPNTTYIEWIEQKPHLKFKCSVSNYVVATPNEMGCWLRATISFIVRRSFLCRSCLCVPLTVSIFDGNICSLS